MKPFLGQDFLLTNKVAEVLYHDYAAKMPIIDYHNHLSPEDLAKNRQFKNITEAWLEGDHYKWRAMRANGIDEKFITGDTSFEIKFHADYYMYNSLLTTPDTTIYTHFLHHHQASTATVSLN